jgi:hypothetical protein
VSFSRIAAVVLPQVSIALSFQIRFKKVKIGNFTSFSSAHLFYPPDDIGGNQEFFNNYSCTALTPDNSNIEIKT